MLSTPYYRTLAPTTVTGQPTFPEYTYTPYNIFCLQSRLYPIVYKMFDRNVELIFRTIHEDSRMNLKIDVVRTKRIKTDGNEITSLEMSSDQLEILQHHVNTIVSHHRHHCIINSKELYRSSGFDYPREWFNTVLPYIKIPIDYRPLYKDEDIYIMFNSDGDYKEGYFQICSMLLSTIKKYYENGVVYNPPTQLIENWGLEKLDNGLYQATWNDKRFAPQITDFLMDKIDGNPYIKIKVPDNMVKRHFIASALSREKIPMKYEGESAIFMVNNLDDAQYIAATINSAAKLAVGKVVTHSFGSMDRVQQYIISAVKLLGPKTDCTGYQTSDSLKPYVFSCLIGMNTSIQEVNERLNLMVKQAYVQSKK